MNGRIFLASGFVALAAIAGVLIMASSPSTPRPASLTEAKLAEAKLAEAKATAPVEKASEPAPAPKAPVPEAPASNEPFVIKRILPISGPIKYGEWHWDETNVPKGPIVITVDLKARVLSVFRDGYEIGATAVLLGTQDKPTPLGVFPITQKDRDHVSNIYTGAPMPYMQRLTDDGITLHGSRVEKGYASHGCVGMPEPFAAKLFAITHLGDKVYITRGKQVGLGDNLVGS
ncbi:MAG: L,D-transpeptidase family protein [Novosphingobium sp.]